MSIGSVFSAAVQMYILQPRMVRQQEAEAYIKWAMENNMLDLRPGAVNEIRPWLTGMEIEKVNMGAIERCYVSTAPMESIGGSHE